MGRIVSYPKLWSLGRVASLTTAHITSPRTVKTLRGDGSASPQGEE